jgi:hypothetical protein
MSCGSDRRRFGVRRPGGKKPRRGRHGGLGGPEWETPLVRVAGWGVAFVEMRSPVSLLSPGADEWETPIAYRTVQERACGAMTSPFSLLPSGMLAGLVRELCARLTDTAGVIVENSNISRFCALKKVGIASVRVTRLPSPDPTLRLGREDTPRLRGFSGARDSVTDRRSVSSWPDWNTREVNARAGGAPDRRGSPARASGTVDRRDRRRKRYKGGQVAAHAGSPQASPACPASRPVLGQSPMSLSLHTGNDEPTRAPRLATA